MAQIGTFTKGDNGSLNGTVERPITAKSRPTGGLISARTLTRVHHSPPLSASKCGKNVGTPTGCFEKSARDQRGRREPSITSRSAIFQFFPDYSRA